MTQKEVWREKASLLRKRFAGREDIFGVTTLFAVKETDEHGQTKLKQEKLVIPACDNYGNQSLCLITQNKGGCSACSNRVYSKLTDEHAYAHITGKREMAVYLLTRDGIKFGACDFDYGDPLGDAKLVRDVSLSLGVPCYMARSSTKGYHLYWFFSDFVKPHVFASFVRFMYDKLGFYERYHADNNSDREYLPESFPKQTVYTEGKLGSCINIPMVETRMGEGFKCWLDGDGKPLPVDWQWKYLREAEEITPERFDAVIATAEIKLLDAPVSRSASAASGGSYEKKPYKTPEHGDFNSIVTKCPALAHFWAKDEHGVYKNTNVPHTARVASLAFAINTKNGIEIIRDRWRSQITEDNIRYAIETNQKPHTCRAMQDNGICHIGIHPKNADKTRCFDKLPPKKKIDGTWVTNPEQVPETFWREPSPSRLARDGNEKKTVQQIIHELEEFIDEATRPEDYEEQIQSLLKSARYLTAEEKKTIQDFIVNHKLMGKRDFNRAEKEVKKLVQQDGVRDKKNTIPSVSVNGKDYFIENGGYTMSYLDAKGMTRTDRLTNFTVELREDIEEINSLDDDSLPDDRAINKRVVIGDILIENQRKPFRCPTDDLFGSADKFFGIITRYGGTASAFLRKDYDYIRIAATQFNRERITYKKRVSDIGHHKHNGEWYYLMPSAVVTKEGVLPNKEYEVNLSDEMSRQLDFAVVGREEFKELASHVLIQYFGCNSQIGAMTGFAHAMAAAIMPFIPLNKKPILWLHGDSGGGKSFILETAQCFFGNFRFFRNMETSDKSKLQAAMDYRHTLLLVDDYKHSLQKDPSSFYRFLQSVYDGSAATKLNRDGSQKHRAPRARGLLCFSGEDVPKQEESNLARMIVVEVGKSKDIAKGEEVLAKRHKYSAVTAYFISYVYNQGAPAVKEIFQKYVDVFEKDIKGNYENSLRIAQNLAYNMTAFHLAMDMFTEFGVKGGDGMINRHVANLMIARAQITNLLRNQRGSEVFLSALQELLNDRARYYIQNYPPHEASEHRNAKPIGFWSDKTPDLVYIHPQTAYGEVKSMTHKGTLSNLQAPGYVARQLVADGHIPPDMYDREGSNFSKQVRGPNSDRPRVWVMKLESLKLDVPEGFAQVPANTLNPPVPNDNPFH